MYCTQGFMDTKTHNSGKTLFIHVSRKCHMKPNDGNGRG